MPIRGLRRLLPFGLLPMAAFILAFQESPATESGRPCKTLNKPVTETPAQGVDQVDRRKVQHLVEVLGACASVQMAPGDVFVVETPGGGGAGAPG